MKEIVAYTVLAVPIYLRYNHFYDRRSVCLHWKIPQNFSCAGVVFDGDWRASMLAGYAGSDFIESMYKLSLAKWIK